MDEESGGLSREEKKRYANAKDVLPEELFEQIQKHYTGILWVPTEQVYQERRDLVLALHLHGDQQPGDLQPRRVTTTAGSTRSSPPNENRTGTDGWPPLPVSNPEPAGAFGRLNRPAPHPGLGKQYSAGFPRH